MELPESIQTRMQEMLDSDLSGMTPERLNRFREKLDALNAEIEALEPEDTESEEFLDWEETLEQLDDLMDDVNDSLDAGI